MSAGPTIEMALPRAGRVDGFLAGCARVLRAAVDSVVVSALLVVAVFLQVTVAVDLRVIGGRPDLVVVLVVCVALLRGPVPGAVAGLAAGLLLDGLGLGILGASSLVLVIVGYGVGTWGERVDEDAPVRPLLAVAVATVASDIGSIGLALLLGTITTVHIDTLLAIVPSAMLDLLAAIALYPLVRRLLRRPFRRPRPAEGTAEDGLQR